MIRPLAVTALLAFAASVTAQDLTIVFKTSDGAVATHYFTKDRIRMNNGRADSVMDFGTGTITNIDHQKKEYSEITLAEMEEAMKSAAAQRDEAMAKMPPQMREQMAKMMGGAAADVTITKGGTRTIAGYACQDYTIAMGTSVSQQTCNSTALIPPFDPANFLKMTRISIPMVQGADKLIAKMQEIKGLALEQHTTVNMMGTKRDIGMEATEIKKGPVAANTFDLPAGYKKVDSPMKTMAKGRR
jgi:hypothetical protein